MNRPWTEEINVTADHDQDQDRDTRMGQAITKGIAIATPVAIVVLAAAIWVITPNSIADSIGTAILPGVLIGVFFGGFVGVARTMD